MEGDSAILRAIKVDALIPENGSAPLSQLLEEDTIGDVEPVKSILNISRRGFVFIGMLVCPACGVLRTNVSIR